MLSKTAKVGSKGLETNFKRFPLARGRTILASKRLTLKGTNPAFIPNLSHISQQTVDEMFFSIETF